MSQTEAIPNHIEVMVVGRVDQDLWLGDVQILADFPSHYFTNLLVTRHRGFSAIRWLPPNRVASALAQQLASVLGEMTNEGPSLHAGIRISS